MKAKKILLSVICVALLASASMGCSEDIDAENPDSENVVSAVVEDDDKEEESVEAEVAEEAEVAKVVEEPEETEVTEVEEEPEEVFVDEESEAESVPQVVEEKVQEKFRPDLEAPQTSQSAPVVDTASEKSIEYLAIAERIEIYSEEHAPSDGSTVSMKGHAYNVFQEWDNLLNDVYQYLKVTMPASEFKALESDEIRWIKEKEAAAKAAGKEFEGGTAQGLAEVSTESEYTRERCYYLISLID